MNKINLDWLIDELQKIRNKYGNLEVYTPIDGELLSKVSHVIIDETYLKKELVVVINGEK